jgi:hypothetical protein
MTELQIPLRYHDEDYDCFISADKKGRIVGVGEFEWDGRSPERAARERISRHKLNLINRKHADWAVKKYIELLNWTAQKLRIEALVRKLSAMGHLVPELTPGQGVILWHNDEVGKRLWSVMVGDEFWLASFTLRSDAVKFIDGLGFHISEEINDFKGE